MRGQERSRTGRILAGFGCLGLVVLALAARADERRAAAGSDVVVQALSLLGTPYRFGGTSPEAGFDCSGLVRHVFAAALGRDLPRRSEEISAVGHAVSRGDLQPGDLVFFDTLRRAYSHVAIYIGQGRFVHAPAARGRVRIEGLNDRYWAARYNGARRLTVAPPVAAVWFAPTEPQGESRPAAGVFAERPPEP